MLRKHQALFCGELGWSMGVEAASFNLAKSSDLIVNVGGSTFYVSVASFGASSAIMCYEDSSNSEYGTCNAIGCGAGMNPACRTDSLLTFDLMTGYKAASPGADGCASCGPGDDPLTCKTFDLTNFVPPRDFCFIIFL